MSGSRPAVAFFCATYLKPEMLHIYRHLTGLKAFRPVVIAQKREGDWPLDQVEVVPRSFWRFLARSREKKTGEPWQISDGEARQMLAGIAREECRVLHIFFGNVAVHLLPLLRACPVPVVVSFHGSDVAGSMASAGYRKAVAEVFQRASVVPCRSEQLASAVEKLGCPTDKLKIMRTILPDIPFVPRSAPEDGAWKIVQAARLVPKKGVGTAMRGFAEFAQTYPKASFTLAGEGPMEAELKGRAGELGLEGRVNFTGFLSQEALRQLLAESHIFLHPSETAGGDVEGVPNAMLEAMASGMPVVATRHGGIPEVIRDGENGLLGTERDAAAVTEALRRLVEDAALYQRLAEQAASSVREQFSAARQVEVIEGIYRELAGAI